MIVRILTFIYFGLELIAIGAGAMTLFRLLTGLLPNKWAVLFLKCSLVASVTALLIPFKHFTLTQEADLRLRPLVRAGWGGQHRPPAAHRHPPGQDAEAGRRPQNPGTGRPEAGLSAVLAGCTACPHPLKASPFRGPSGLGRAVKDQENVASSRT